MMHESVEACREMKSYEHLRVLPRTEKAMLGNKNACALLTVSKCLTVYVSKKLMIDIDFKALILQSFTDTPMHDDTIHKCCIES